MTYSSCLIIPNPDTGWVDGTKNDCKIQGAWYAYSDCTTSTPDDCTQGQEPKPGATTGIPNTGGVMCTSGTTVPTGKDYTKWGAGIGLNLNQQQPGDTNKNPIAQLGKPFKGFTFTLSGPVVPSKINVNFPTQATKDDAHFKQITAPGDYQVLFSDAAQPGWVTTPTALDSGNVVSVQFQVVANETESVPFNFCVEKLSALY